MVELFSDIPQEVRDRAKFWVDMSLRQNTLIQAAKMIREYMNSCVNEEEADYVDFYFNVRMEELLNASNNGQRKKRFW